MIPESTQRGAQNRAHKMMIDGQNPALLPGIENAHKLDLEGGLLW